MNYLYWRRWKCNLRTNLAAGSGGSSSKFQSPPMPRQFRYRSIKLSSWFILCSMTYLWSIVVLPIWREIPTIYFLASLTLCQWLKWLARMIPRPELGLLLRARVGSGDAETSGTRGAPPLCLVNHTLLLPLRWMYTYCITMQYATKSKTPETKLLKNIAHFRCAVIKPGDAPVSYHSTTEL